MENDLLLHDAIPMDAPFIARVVLAGIDMLAIDAEAADEQKPVLEYLMDICRMDDTLYSYKHTRIAELGGKVVGALIGYDGARYAEMRTKTFNLVQQTSGLDLSKNAMETGSGEYYLDSMAILPEYRGRKIGLLLIRDRMDWAKHNGFEAVTLLVDKDKQHLQRYYESLGFAFSEEMFVFGAWYRKLVCVVSVIP